MPGGYEIYSDESGSGEDRFCAIGTLSGSPEDIGALRLELSEAIMNHGLGHCEYKEVGGATRLNCALDYLQVLHRYIHQQRIKVLVLVWDKHDSRHAVVGRDDAANMSIMYYWALRTTKRQWRDSGLDSSFFPDELTHFDFGTLVNYIQNTRIRDRENLSTLFGQEFTQMFPVITAHSERVSTDEPVIQMIDLVTGMVRLSYEESETFAKWRHDYDNGNAGQNSLFGPEEPAVSVKKKKVYKYRLIHEFNAMCKADSLNIALMTTDGFHSHRPSCGYFFWLYKPQRADDKAPVR